ncbi:MAG TPA: trimeric intracellular cation channel family protein [Prosthecobacter sp.]|nr:trimeric intracellular cation channel family protein [Prosthecobacter sp.]HRK16588.1 trimeric intracellular cation channel family protein [Prosthecobacter sp.]
MPPWIEYSAVAVCAISGVLAAEGKRMDLFGALVLALVTAVGGGTLRDLCLGAEPVFWIRSPAHVTTALGAALATFILARFVVFPARALALADAFGLALFGIVGTEKALLFDSPAIVAILLGVVTGVAGGILRDVLRQEVPEVFRTEIELYATAVFAGALVYVLLRQWLPPSEAHRYIGMGVILLMRLAAMRWRLRLPAYRSRSHVPPGEGGK